MNANELFLLQHANVHSAAIGGNPASAAERTFGSITDEQMRIRPHERLNSVAWVLFHIARCEDIIVNAVIASRSQVFGDAWGRRLGVTRPDFGIGMTSAEVTDLTGQVKLDALRAYRGEVGARTREIVAAFKDADWQGMVTTEDLERAGAQGAFGSRRELVVKVQSGRPRAGVLSALAIFHCLSHMGEARATGSRMRIRSCPGSSWSKQCRTLPKRRSQRRLRRTEGSLASLWSGGSCSDRRFLILRRESRRCFDSSGLTLATRSDKRRRYEMSSSGSIHG